METTSAFLADASGRDIEEVAQLLREPFKPTILFVPEMRFLVFVSEDESFQTATVGGSSLELLHNPNNGSVIGFKLNGFPKVAWEIITARHGDYWFMEDVRDEYVTAILTRAQALDTANTAKNKHNEMLEDLLQVYQHVFDFMRGQSFPVVKREVMCRAAELHRKK